MQKYIFYFLIVIGVLGIIDLGSKGVVTTFLSSILGSLIAAHFAVYVSGFWWIFLLLAWLIRRDMKNKSLALRGNKTSLSENS